MVEFLKRVDYLRFIEHDYLLPILDYGKHEGLPYIVYADDSLSLLRAHPGAQAGQEATLQFLYGAAQALDFLHRQEIIHGALNPDNILLDAAGIPRVFDFGLSAIFKSVLQENLDDGFQNLCVAEPACTAPEQLQGLNPTRASDIYALGMSGYYFMFGGFPAGQPETASQNGKSGLQKVRLPGDVSEAVLHFVEKCIQPEPGGRFASMTQALKALDRLLAGKRSRLQFKKRFIVEKAPSRARYVGMYIGALLLLASLVVSLYLFLPAPTWDAA